MAKPVLFAIDDDSEVLRAVDRDLRRQYGEHYRVMRATPARARWRPWSSSSCAASPVALLLVDQRMPRMSGVEFLEQAIAALPRRQAGAADRLRRHRRRHPRHQHGGVDYYLLKPWDPPEERLYPVLDDLLDDWQAGFRPPFEGVRVVGHRWSPPTPSSCATSWPATRCPTAGWTSRRERRGPQAARRGGGGRRRAARWCCFTDGTRAGAARPRAELAEKIGLHDPGRAAVLRPGDRRRRAGGAGGGGLRRLRGAAHAAGRARGARRPGRAPARGSRTTSASPPGSPAPTSTRRARRPRPSASASRSSRRRRSRASAWRTPTASSPSATAREVSCHALLIATGVSYRKLDVPGVDG